MAFTYRKRNYIESVFQQFHREFRMTGIQAMGARALVFGLSLVFLALWAMARTWRGLYTTPGRFDYSLFEILMELYRFHTYADEPG